MANAINWFEIPAANLDRAASFYKKVLDSELHYHDVQDIKMAMFHAEEGGVSGAVCASDDHTPSMTGTTVYLNGGDDLSVPLGRVEASGGKILVPKTKISDEIGYFAMFSDTEGNKVAFHSPN